MLSSLPAIDNKIFLNISELLLSSAKTPPSLIAELLSLLNDHGKWSGLLFKEIDRLASRILCNAPATPTARFATVLNSNSLSNEKLRWRGSRSFWRFRRLARVIRLLSVGSRRLETQLTRRLIRRPCGPSAQVEKSNNSYSEYGDQLKGLSNTQDIFIGDDIFRKISQLLLWLMCALYL